MKHILNLTALTMLASTGPMLADPAQIVSAEARKSGNGWTFSVTLRHAETGWDDYANGWRVVGTDGTIIGTRVLAHPHQNEQPFTRSLSGVQLPDGTTQVLIEASTLTGGWEGEKLTLTIED